MEDECWFVTAVVSGAELLATVAVRLRIEETALHGWVSMLNV